MIVKEIVIEKNKTIEQVKADIASDPAAMIFYAVHSCWWTHNPKHLGKASPPKGITVNGVEIEPHLIPVDPRGSVLMQTREGDALTFIENAEKDPSHYGKHGLSAFMAAHHENCFQALIETQFKRMGRVVLSKRNWSMDGWAQYNEAIDKLKETTK
jgi:hypothetical protein